jgi:hypothetical protein
MKWMGNSYFNGNSSIYIVHPINNAILAGEIPSISSKFKNMKEILRNEVSLSTKVIQMCLIRLVKPPQ